MKALRGLGQYGDIGMIGVLILLILLCFCIGKEPPPAFHRVDSPNCGVEGDDILFCPDQYRREVHQT